MWFIYDDKKKNILGKFKDETATGVITDVMGIHSKC